MSSSLEHILRQFQTIGLNNLGDARLMKRVDTKFLFHIRFLDTILEKAIHEYNLVIAGDAAISSYRNQYYDTENLQFYHDHHRGKGKRIKVRCRAYGSSGPIFMEVKEKDNKGTTTKTRVEVGEVPGQISIPSTEHTFLQDVGNPADRPYNLVRTMKNRFERITLVHRKHSERATFDFNYRCDNGVEDKTFKNLVIAEVKQPHLDRSSPVMQILGEQRIRPLRMSKYCVGMASLNEDLKQNNFKKKLLKISKITA